MATRSTIMDTNSFRAEHAAGLDTDIRSMTDKRSKVPGESYRLFYRSRYTWCGVKDSLCGTQPVISILMFTTM